MKVCSVNSINNRVLFHGKIIDAHAHLGNWQGNRYSIEQMDTFVKSPLSNGDTIDKVLVSSLSAICDTGKSDEISGNTELLNMIKHDKQYAPLAVCQPKTGSVENIEKLFTENPDRFIGLKFHPDGHEIMASSEKLNPYLRFAQKNKLPCLFHCGIAWNGDKLVDESLRYSSPDEIYKAAKKIPDTPVIMAHLGAGGEQVHSKAIDVLMNSIEKKDANLFVDISWVDVDNPNKPTIVKLINKLKEKNSLNRILFGSDAPIGEFSTGKDGLSGKAFYDKTVVDIKKAIKTNFPDDAGEITDKIFYKNADELFFKKQKGGNTSGLKKIVPFVVTGLVAIGAICAVCSKSNISKTSK